MTVEIPCSGGHVPRHSEGTLTVIRSGGGAEAKNPLGFKRTDFVWGDSSRSFGMTVDHAAQYDN